MAPRCARVALAAALPVALAGAACAPAERPAVPDRPVLTAAGLENIAIRETVVAFLEAYAASGERADALAALVSGPDLTDWAHWVGVQNRDLSRPLEGRVEVHSFGVLRVEEDLAAAALDATVVFAVGDQGEPSPPRRFQSPVILSRLPGPGRWAVFDVVRDGRPMRESITVFDPPPSGDGHGLGVQVASLFRFTNGTVVNLRIRNATARPIRLDVPHTIIQVEGRFVGAQAATSSLTDTLPPGELVEGALNFPGVDLGWLPEVVMVRVAGADQPILVPLPPEAFGTEG